MLTIDNVRGPRSPDTPIQSARDNVKGTILVLALALPIMAVVSLFAAIPKLAQHFSDVPNAAYLVPMIITLPSLGIALLSPAAGWLVDKLGRRPIFIAALTLYAVTGLAPLVLNDLRYIIASRALLSAAEAGIVTVCNTLIADYFGANRYRWLAIQSALGSVLGTVLIALGGWLADVSWRGPFSVYVATIPLLILALIYIDEPAARVRDQEERSERNFPWAIALTIGVVSLIASVFYYVEPINIASVFTQRGISSSTQAGLIQALTSIAYIAGAYLYKRLGNHPITTQLTVAGGLIGIGMIGIGLSHTYREAALWALPQQLGGGMVIPSLTAWAQGSAPFNQRGRAMGVWATFFFAGLFLCPSVVTATASKAGGLSSAFWLLGLLTCALTAVGLVAAQVVRRFPRT